MAERAVRYRQPSLALRPFITTYYWVDVPGGGPPVTDWLHPEWPNVRFLLDGGWRSDVGSGMVEVPACALFGPTRRAAKVVGDSPSRLVGLGLLPLGFATLFDLEAASLSHRLGPLEDHMPCVRGLHAALAAETDDTRQADLLDTYFEAKVAARPPAPDLLRRAHAVLLDPEVTTVDVFAQALAISPRHLLRLCRRLFGFPPKLLLRRQRFMRTLEAVMAAPGTSFTQVLDDAYFDHSHFVRDFHHFMGMSPTAYLQLERPLMGVAQLERLKAWGASFQGLHAERMRLARPESGSSKPPPVGRA